MKSKKPSPFFNALRDKEDFDRERLRRSLCLAACRNDPARCGQEDRRRKK